MSDKSATKLGSDTGNSTALVRKEILPRKREGVVVVNLSEIGFTLNTSDETLAKIERMRLEQHHAWLRTKDAVFK